MSGMGRPVVLDEHKKALILALLKTGCGRMAAAHCVNCHPQTIANTAKREPEFAEKMATAEHAAMLVHLQNINRASNDVKYWRASAWALERLIPDRFAKTNPDAVTPPQFSALILQLAEVIVQEVPVARFRTQVLKRLDEILSESNVQLIAGPPQIAGMQGH